MSFSDMCGKTDVAQYLEKQKNHTCMHTCLHFLRELFGLGLEILGLPWNFRGILTFLEPFGLSSVVWSP